MQSTLSEQIPATLESLDQKPWWESRTIWGGFIAVIAGLTALIGIELDQDLILDAVLSIAAAIGGLLAVYGRFKAHQPLGVSPKSSERADELSDGEHY